MPFAELQQNKVESQTGREKREGAIVFFRFSHEDWLVSSLPTPHGALLAPTNRLYGIQYNGKLADAISAEQLKVGNYRSIDVVEYDPHAGLLLLARRDRYIEQT